MQVMFHALEKYTRFQLENYLGDADRLKDTNGRLKLRKLIGRM